MSGGLCAILLSGGGSRCGEDAKLEGDMFLLDLLAKYGSYAFVLMGVWFSAAFVAAAC